MFQILDFFWVFCILLIAGKKLRPKVAEVVHCVNATFLEGAVNFVIVR